MFDDRNRLRCLGICRGLTVAACALLFAFGSQLAHAQSFTWETIDPAYEKLTSRSAQKGLKTQIVMGNTRLSSNREVFEDWYRKYLFPAMSSREFIGEVRDNRDSLAKDLEMAADPATHRVLSDLAYEEAVKRATGNYHPAVRFNAMLIIGNLNESEQRLAERLPAVRLPKAFDFLLSELQKPNQLDVLRVAAMVGIERHLRLVAQRPQDQPIPDAKIAEVTAQMMALAKQKTAPAGRVEDAHTWLRRRSIDLLAAIGKVGDNQSVFNMLVELVGASDEPLPLRCTAARAIGELKYTDVTGIDPVVTVQKLGALAAFACRTEDTWIKEQQKELEKSEIDKPRSGGYPGMGGAYPGGSGSSYPGGSDSSYPGSSGSSSYPGSSGSSSYPGSSGGYPGMGGGSGGYPGMGGTAMASIDSEPMQDLMEDARRRLKLPVYFAQLGIRGEEKKSYGTASATPTLGSVAQLATDDTQKAEIQKVLDALDELIVATDSIEDGFEEMMTQVRTKTRDLESLLPASAATAAPANPADDALPGAELPGAAAEPPAAAEAEPGK